MGKHDQSGACREADWQHRSGWQFGQPIRLDEKTLQTSGLTPTLKFDLFVRHSLLLARSIGILFFFSLNFVPLFFLFFLLSFPFFNDSLTTLNVFADRLNLIMYFSFKTVSTSFNNQWKERQMSCAFMGMIISFGSTRGTWAHKGSRGNCRRAVALASQRAPPSTSSQPPCFPVPVHPRVSFQPTFHSVR